MILGTCWGNSLSFLSSFQFLCFKNLRTFNGAVYSPTWIFNSQCENEDVNEWMIMEIDGGIVRVRTFSITFPLHRLFSSTSKSFHPFFLQFFFLSFEHSLTSNWKTNFAKFITRVFNSNLNIFLVHLDHKSNGFCSTSSSSGIVRRLRRNLQHWIVLLPDANSISMSSEIKALKAFLNYFRTISLPSIPPPSTSLMDKSMMDLCWTNIEQHLKSH